MSADVSDKVVYKAATRTEFVNSYLKADSTGRIKPGSIPKNGKCPWCNHKYAGELMRQHAKRVHGKLI